MLSELVVPNYWNYNSFSETVMVLADLRIKLSIYVCIADCLSFEKISSSSGQNV